MIFSYLCQRSPGDRVGAVEGNDTCGAHGAAGHFRSPVAEVGHDIPWNLRDVALFAARKLDANPAPLWGSGAVIQRTKDTVADWCAAHLGPVDVVETENGRVLRFTTEADLLLFMLRWF